MRHIFHRLKLMPETLKGLSISLGICGPSCVLMAVLPISSYKVGGSPVTYAEFWSSGGGPVMTLAGAIMLVLAIAFYKAQRWVKIVIPAVFGIAAIVMPVISIEDRWYGFIGLSIWSISSWWYLNRKRDIARYFATRGG